MPRALCFLLGIGALSLILVAPLGSAIGAEAGAPGTPAIQEPPILLPASALPEPAGTHALAAVGAGVGTVAHAPFKAVVLCPLMALASGVSQLLPVRRSTPTYLLRAGCHGTYLITPEMVRGRQEFHGGGPLVEPERVRPEQRAEASTPAARRTPDSPARADAAPLWRAR